MKITLVHDKCVSYFTLINQILFEILVKHLAQELLIT